ncbi:hypothetical protein C7M84_025354 [Penaeus vannamei]|uniref:Protein kinase domain-containing protein n=1 Tax=Penaeus vannamei TaxID=6689 RepID=A0A423TYF3_PENVA|nr:hypothetical protein C7M84_025354 [Penaeus vannamei]
MDALEVPLWSAVDLLKKTIGCTATSLGSGFFGDALLYSDARGSFVVKTMPCSNVDSFFNEVRALARVRGVEGVQQLQAIMVGGALRVVSTYAGETLKKCLADRLLSLQRALERLHAAGVAHKDLHQENVCVLFGDEETVRASVIDLGFASLEDSRTFKQEMEKDAVGFSVLVGNSIIAFLREMKTHKKYLNQETLLQSDVDRLEKWKMSLKDAHPVKVTTQKSNPREQDDLVSIMMTHENKETTLLMSDSDDDEEGASSSQSSSDSDESLDEESDEEEETQPLVSGRKRRGSSSDAEEVPRQAPKRRRTDEEDDDHMSQGAIESQADESLDEESDEEEETQLLVSGRKRSLFSSSSESSAEEEEDPRQAPKRRRTDVLLF